MSHPSKEVESIPFRFKISGNLIKKLGEESIANKNIAILELIKNSYDAGATLVDIKFNNLSSPNPSIVVSDNGKGMSSTDLENKWLNIATPNKSQELFAKGERISVGEKGIGRLSSESLGNQTILITNPKNEISGFKIIFDWLKYLDKNALANEIINEGFKLNKKRAESGTILEIYNLRHDWNDSNVQKNIVKDLFLLHPPFSKPKNFRITTSLKIPTLKQINKKLLDNSAYHLKIYLIKGDVIKYEAATINGKSKKGEIKLERKLNCGDANFELYYFYRSAPAIKSALNYSITSSTIRECNSTLDEYYGIKIYRDSFRVKPYGEDGNDWLGLDTNFQNNSMYPRNNNVFGFVNLSKLSNPKIIDTTTREGIIYNSEFQDLQKFIQISIEEVFVKFRSEIESHKKKAKKNKKTKRSNAQVVSINKLKQKSKISSAKLIDNIASTYPQSFYSQLVEEINNSYISNYPNAAFFLTRKLIENLIFNTLEKKYPKDVNLWYDINTNSHLKLSSLIKNLYCKKSDFKPNAQKYIEKFNVEIGHFRKEANTKAHNIFEYLADKSELKVFKINDLVQLLLNIYNHS